MGNNTAKFGFNEAKPFINRSQLTQSKTCYHYNRPLLSIKFLEGLGIKFIKQHKHAILYNDT